jgi:hypothetical protein
LTPGKLLDDYMISNYGTQRKTTILNASDVHSPWRAISFRSTQKGKREEAALLSWSADVQWMYAGQKAGSLEQYFAVRCRVSFGMLIFLL